MPRDLTSPFSPGHTVPVRYFVGRLQEVERLQRRVDSSLTGRVQCAFVVGERGIGKSSLARFVKRLCERNFMTVHAMLGGVTTLEGFVQTLFDHLIKEQVDRPAFKAIRELVDDRITEVGLFGVSVKFDPRPEDVDLLVRNFVPSLRKLTEKVKDEKNGLLIILDDLNGLANEPVFANWFKSMVDEIGVSGKSLPVAFVLAGLEERRLSMIKHQPSVGRIFDVIDIRPWSDEETRSFYENAFSSVEATVDPNAMKNLVRYAGGLPVLAHEIGDAAFIIDKDSRIDNRDAADAILYAAEVIGRKYLDPLVFQSMRSARYRNILNTLFDNIRHTGTPTRFSRADLMKRLSREEGRVLDNFLRRMKELGVVEDSPEEGRGVYRFANLLHQLYIHLEVTRSRNVTQ